MLIKKKFGKLIKLTIKMSNLKTKNNGWYMLSLFYIKAIGNSPIKNKRESFVFVFESTSKFSAISNVIAYLYQLGFSNIDIEKCHIAKTQQEIAAYFHCYNNQQ